MNTFEPVHKKSGFLTISIFLLVTGVSPQSASAQGIVNSNLNPSQIATLHWYGADQSTRFAVGKFPCGLAFDGANMWVANLSDNTVTKLRANDGTNLGTFAA